ncbi:hypothetical protein IAQ61_000130 [Plenodomus lingam]|uniref:uncharacterized protein n=1 Tax=Leptosphaeria maculans TaxID=5022 RepID=UPI0033270860|nr:hypothetical protein IAQ61_000130 [Plenodomus lingam]
MISSAVQNPFVGSSVEPCTMRAHRTWIYIFPMNHISNTIPPELKAPAVQVIKNMIFHFIQASDEQSLWVANLALKL